MNSRQNNTPAYRPTLLIRIPSDAIPITAAHASSSLAGSPPALAIDSDFNTRWTASTGTPPTQSWILLDLGSRQPANRLSLTPFQFGRSYKLQCSPDNASWSTVADHLTPGSGNSVNVLQTTNPSSARCVR